METSFLPIVFSLVGVNERDFAFDPSPWSIEAFDTGSVVGDPDDSAIHAVPILASHVYLRGLQAVPSLIRGWFEAQRNRQLSASVAGFTAKHFSPVLIGREMAAVEAARLGDDDLVVKVSATGAEVRAVYTVDETPMELSLRLPVEFPLATVVVGESRSRVGISEPQWRAWILAVQQVVTAQNGLVADALALFKRNVALHFEGVEACAICYSIISVLDRTLPTKRCRTCKNLFHGSCLFKWFATSSGSTCPLCRAIF